MNNPYSEVTTTRLPSMRVASYCAKSQTPEDDSIAFLRDWVERNGLKERDGMRFFGFDAAVTDEQQKAGIRGYEYWATIPDDFATSDEVEIKEIAGDEYAVLRIQDPFSDPFALIPAGWQRLMIWVKQNGCDPVSWDRRYCLEEVIEGANGTSMDIYCPIR